MIILEERLYVLLAVPLARQEGVNAVVLRQCCGPRTPEIVRSEIPPALLASFLGELLVPDGHSLPEGSRVHVDEWHIIHLLKYVVRYRL